MKKFVLLLGSVALCALAISPAYSLKNSALKQSQNPWYRQGQTTLQKKLQIKPNKRRAKNIILFIADGNGITSNYVNRLFAGQRLGEIGEKHVQAHEGFPYVGLVKTYNTNGQTPDSAGTGTALHTGVKTRVGVIGVDERVARGACSKTASGEVAVPSEIFSTMRKSVGVVSTARITHATPATAYAHAADRAYEDNSQQPKDCTYPDIAQQLIENLAKGNVDIALGGGARHFVPMSLEVHGALGKRSDNKHLINKAQARGVTYVSTAQELRDAVNAVTDSPLLGFFSSSHMAYEEDRTNEEPSLADMSEAALAILQKNKQGYFLTIEAGRIDHAHHANNLHRAAKDGEAFAHAIERVMQKVNVKDTLVIVTTDHSHGLALAGYCGLNSPITGLCYGIDAAGSTHNAQPNMAKDNKPYTTAGYITGSETASIVGKSDGRPRVTNEQAMRPDYLQQALVPLKSETHGGEDVAVYATGPWAHLLTGTIEQNFIFTVIMHAVGK